MKTIWRILDAITERFARWMTRGEAWYVDNREES